MKNCSFLLLFCCVPLGLAGCGSANPFGTVPVTGKITVDGEPMSGVSISFTPTDEAGMTAYGMTVADGTFQLTTGGAPFGTGAKPGSYYLTFSKVEATGQGVSLADIEAGVVQRGGGPAAPTYLIPKKFSDPKTTGFDPVEVKKSGKNNFSFNLETK